MIILMEISVFELLRFYMWVFVCCIPLFLMFMAGKYKDSNDFNKSSMECLLLYLGFVSQLILLLSFYSGIIR